MSVGTGMTTVVGPSIPVHLCWELQHLCRNGIICSKQSCDSSISSVLFQIFSGLLVNLPSVMGWLNWLKYFSIPRYGLTALQVNEYRDLYFCGEKNPNATVFVGDTGSCPPSISEEMCSGEAYLCSQGIAPTSWAMWENIVALFCMTVIFLIIAYAKLRFMRKFT